MKQRPRIYYTATQKDLMWERCGLAEEMLDSMGQLFGRVRGGLCYPAINVGFVLGAITGTVAAQVIAMAMISLPVIGMALRLQLRYATGVLAASGTITQLVPPSLVLIVLADKPQYYWSPQQIAGWLKQTYPDQEDYQVSHETIYRSLFIQARGALKKELTQHLRRTLVGAPNPLRHASERGL